MSGPAKTVVKPHGFLHPAILKKPTRKGKLEELEFLFDRPMKAASATVTILEGDQSFEPKPTLVSLLVVKGKIDGGIFTPDTAPPAPTSETPTSRVLRLRIRGPRQTSAAGPWEITFPSTSNFWPTEGNVAELVSRFDVVFDDKSTGSNSSKVSVLVRQNDLYPKEKLTGGVLAAINGTGGYFDFANKFWKSRADSVQPPRVRTLKQLRNFLAPKPIPKKKPKDPTVLANPWSEASMVFHGNGTQAILDFGSPQEPSKGQKFVDEDLLSDEMTLGGSGAAATTLQPHTRVVLRGCNVGRNLAFLALLKKFLGCAQVVAPRFLQTYFQYGTGGTAEGLSLRVFLYDSTGKPTDLDIDGLAAALASRYAPGTPFEPDVIAMCPHFQGLTGTASTSAWKTALEHSLTLLHGKSVPKKFGFTALENVSGAKDTRQSMGLSARRIFLAHQAHKTAGANAVRTAVEESAKAQWLAKTHPHATSGDFDQLDFTWMNPDNSGTAFGGIELHFKMEMTDGTFTTFNCVDHPDWHLLVPALTSKSTFAAIKAALAAKKARPANPTPDVKFSPADLKRFSWYLTQKAGVDMAKVKRKFVVDDTWRLDYSNLIRLTAKTFHLHAELVRQTPDGAVLPPESFEMPFYGAA